MTKGLKNARNKVLVDNTAQAVFKHLDRIKDNRRALGARWIWELLQNARDAADRQGVRIRAHVSATEFRFEHDGRPFASEEIAHLIYHGSTKIEDFEDIGQFGSGFLATHLLSEIIRVTGRLEDSRGFDFPLDRAGGTAEELREAMERSWAAFEQSVEDARAAPDAITSFAYAIAEPGARELAETGLEELRRSGPLVLAFCPEIKEIAVDASGSEWKLSRGSEEEGSVLTIRHVAERGELSRFVAVAGADAECCAALQLRRGESGLEVDQAQETAAKLFVLFPLIGSERLGLPATVNSRRFKPREDRDGIVAGDSLGAQENRRLLEESMRHQEQLFEWCAQKKWAGAERMLAFDTTYLPDWADSAPWFSPLLTRLVRKARETPLMRTAGGEWIEPQAAWLPATDEPSHRERLWKLMSSWKGAEARLPCLDDLASWSRNLSGWRRLLDRSHEDMGEALTITKVARLVGDAGSVDELQERLASGTGLSWLVSLLELARDAGETGLLDEHNLLPTQSGGLRRRPDLHRDEGISEELKDIAGAFGLEIRDELLDKDVELEGLAELLASQREPELLDRVLARVKEECREEVIRAPLALWAVRLFRWMADHPDYFERLEGYPVPTSERSDEGVAVLLLERGREAPARPLAPLATWPENAQRFASLFPRRRVLAETCAAGDPEVWRRLAASGYVNASPLIETQRVVEAFLPDEPLPELDGGSHKSTQEVEISDVACLVEPDIGLIDTARKSRKRATELVRFLVEFAVDADERAFEECEVECECGVSHRTYRAAWLAPLRRRRWVPLDASGRRATTASAESLAGLLADSPETSKILSGVRSEKLLDALAISRADLALRVVAGDEDERLALIASMQDLAAAAGDVDRVRELATEIREHPEIIDSIEERRIRRNKIRLNQEIGSLVEQLLRQELEGRGLIVRRTGIGSDFEVESDFVEDEQEVGLELSGSRGRTLIEVKSTRIDRLKMTPVQAARACQLGDGFALCVVPLGDDAPTGETIRRRLRVVFGIGARLESALSDYEFLREAADAAREPRGAVELEIVEGEARFRIARAVWEDGLPFGQAVGRFGSRG
ncbi:MAG: ATP-binding protein [Acidobacteria bacterium]|nr:ATP-binding protein [Acidobacteriota bacterium]MYJ04568.1 ATP-binding protein [Acidobacteriota bacterium]